MFLLKRLLMWFGSSIVLLPLASLIFSVLCFKKLISYLLFAIFLWFNLVQLI